MDILGIADELWAELEPLLPPLALHHERRADLFQAFVTLACCVICHRRLTQSSRL